MGSGVGEGSCLETQLGVGQEGFSAVSWLQAPFLPLGLAGTAGQGGGHLPGGGQSLYLYLSSSPCPSFNNSAWDPAHLLRHLPAAFPSLCLRLSDSLCLSLGPWILSLWAWVSPPRCWAM